MFASEVPIWSAVPAPEPVLLGASIVIVVSMPPAPAFPLLIMLICPVVPDVLLAVIVNPVAPPGVKVTEVPVAAPRTGVTRVGVFAKTAAPVPVSSVKAAARFAELGVVRNVATPAPNPETPVVIGKPVAFVSVPDVGVPRTGVTNVGLVANTSAPLPVSSLMTPASCADVVAANCESGLPVTPHVGHAIVPVEVIVPPVMGEVVAMLVTVPPPVPVVVLSVISPSFTRLVSKLATAGFAF